MTKFQYNYTDLQFTALGALTGADLAVSNPRVKMRRRDRILDERSAGQVRLNYILSKS